MNLFEHLPGCTPMQACTHCRAVDFLKARKLTIDDIEAFAKIFAGSLGIHINELDFSVRTANCLRNERLFTLGDIIKKTEAEILRIPNFGRRSTNELREVLAKHGLAFKPAETET
jgi:DNA-directed RNA polymerase alpha subunit